MTALSHNAAYNEPKFWGKSELWAKPPHVDVPYWQSRINDICGTSRGEPIIKLVWAWEPQEFWYTEWDSCGRGTKGELRPRYEFLTVPISRNRTVPICAPRWVLEERMEPGQFLADWNSTRFIEEASGIVNPVTGAPVMRRLDLRGEPPLAAQYQFWQYVAAHKEGWACCERTWRVQKRICFGVYLDPNEQMLVALRKVKQMQAESQLRPDPEVPLDRQPGVMATIERETAAHLEAEDARQDKELADIYEPFIRTHGWRAFTDSTKALHWGRWKMAFPVKQFIGKAKAKTKTKEIV